MDVLKLTMEQFCELLLEKGFSQQVTSNFRENGIDGSLFAEMTEDELKEVAPMLADRIKLRKMKLQATAETLEKENMPSISHSEQQQQPPHLPASQQPTPRLPANPHLWLTSFTIPAGFSANTEDAISTGILTSKVRTEIVQSLSASILVHTKKPTPEEYNTICSKLIDTYPTLRDEYGGSGYASWKKKLRDRFKFLRSRKRSGATSGDTEEVEPPSKRVRDDEYKELVAEIQMEMSKRKKDRNIAAIQRLTTETFSGRREWKLKEAPAVFDINQKFPSLKVQKVFRSEFKRITGLADEMSIHSLLESWDVWQQRIVAYSRLECANRKQLKNYITQFDSSSDDIKGILALQMLEAFLIPKTRKERLVHFAELSWCKTMELSSVHKSAIKKNSADCLVHSVQNSDDLSDFGGTVGLSAPFLCVCQTSEGVTIHVIVEQEPLFESTAVSSAILHLIGSYFIYNIEYPKPLKSLLLMIQHHILGLSDKINDPPCVIQIVTMLRRLLND